MLGRFLLGLFQHATSSIIEGGAGAATYAFSLTSTISSASFALYLLLTSSYFTSLFAEYHMFLCASSSKDMLQGHGILSLRANHYICVLNILSLRAKYTFSSYIHTFSMHNILSLFSLCAKHTFSVCHYTFSACKTYFLCVQNMLSLCAKHTLSVCPTYMHTFSDMHTPLNLPHSFSLISTLSLSSFPPTCEKDRSYLFAM